MKPARAAYEAAKALWNAPDFAGPARLQIALGIEISGRQARKAAFSQIREALAGRKDSYNEDIENAVGGDPTHLRWRVLEMENLEIMLDKLEPV